MFDELSKYKVNNHFFFSDNDQLENVCNAPKSGAGVYTVFALANGRIELVYIGSSGKLKNDGSIKVRNGGIFDRIVNGKQFEDQRKKSWPNRMKTENIEALDIYWYETFNKKSQDIPTFVKSLLLQLHFEQFGRLPRWNLEY
ncbi:MAG: hypothetical protein ACI9Z3_002198 [Roseivirga sp.]|jgi:hypothetical protein